jgi:hypothetical protein
LFRREADRLRSMADSFTFYAVREQFLRMAGEYEALARQARPAPRARSHDAAD